MECVCPSASPSFPSMGWWINKNFPLAGSLRGMWHTVSRSPRFSRWLARSFTDKITSHTVRGGIQERGVISKIEAELHPRQFTNGNLCAFGQLAYMCVCVPRQGSCLIIRAKSANRLDWETPSIHLSKFHHWTRHSIASAHPEWCLTNRHSGMFLAEKFVSVTCKKLVTKTVFRGQNVSLIKSQSSTTPCETQKGHFQKISLLSSLVMYRV